MAGAQAKSMLYLESRCVALARAIGAQGVQNGGIDGASVAAAVPSGLRELMAENVMVMARGLESCSGNDALMSESDMRRTSRTLPIVLAGSDFVFSGFGSIQRYDNMFGPSNFNAEDIDDFLAMQRDWGVDGGLRTVLPVDWSPAKPAQLLLAGGPAGDDELAGVLARSLPETVMIGRASVGGTVDGGPLGHRYAAALGLALAPGRP